MSLSAQPDGEHVIISHTSGTAEIRIREHVDHVRHFWGELGAIVNAAEKVAETVDDIEAALEGDGGM